MSQIQVSLEGGSAIAIAQAIQALPGLESLEVEIEQGEVLRGERTDRALLILTTGAAIAGLLNDGSSVVKEVFGATGSQTVPSALIQSGSRQVKLENATPGQIVEVLKAMQ